MDEYRLNFVDLSDQCYCDTANCYYFVNHSIDHKINPFEKCNSSRINSMHKKVLYETIALI